MWRLASKSGLRAAPKFEADPIGTTAEVVRAVRSPDRLWRNLCPKCLRHIDLCHRVRGTNLCIPCRDVAVDGLPRYLGVPADFIDMRTIRPVIVDRELALCIDRVEQRRRPGPFDAGTGRKFRKRTRRWAGGAAAGRSPAASQVPLSGSPRRPATVVCRRLAPAFTAARIRAREKPSKCSFS